MRCKERQWNLGSKIYIFLLGKTSYLQAYNYMKTLTIHKLKVYNYDILCIGYMEFKKGEC